MFQSFRKHHPPSGPYYLVVTHELSETTTGLIEDLIGTIGRNNGELALIAQQLTTLEGKVDTLMATQEERLQAIQAGLAGVADGVNTLQQQVADLKASNPALDDEISAIEATVKGIADDINGVTSDTGSGSTTTGVVTGDEG